MTVKKFSVECEKKSVASSWGPIKLDLCMFVQSTESLHQLILSTLWSCPTITHSSLANLNFLSPAHTTVWVIQPPFNASEHTPTGWKLNSNGSQHFWASNWSWTKDPTRFLSRLGGPLLLSGQFWRQPCGAECRRIRIKGKLKSDYNCTFTNASLRDWGWLPSSLGADGIGLIITNDTNITIEKSWGWCQHHCWAMLGLKLVQCCHCISKPALLFNWADSSWQSTQPVQLCASLSQSTPVQSNPQVFQ